MKSILAVSDHVTVDRLIRSVHLSATISKEQESWIKTWAPEPSTNEHKRSQMNANELPRFAGKFICMHLASFVLVCARLGGPKSWSPNSWPPDIFAEFVYVWVRARGQLNKGTRGGSPLGINAGSMVLGGLYSPKTGPSKFPTTKSRLRSEAPRP